MRGERDTRTAVRVLRVLPQLLQEPERQNDERRQKKSNRTKREPEKKLELRFREAGEIRAHYRRDRARRADERHRRRRISQRVRERRHQTAGEVEKNEQRPSIHVFDERTGDEKEQHVAEEMHEAGVDEHRREKLQRRTVRGDVAPSQCRNVADAVLELLGHSIELRLLRIEFGILAAHRCRRRRELIFEPRRNARLERRRHVQIRMLREITQRRAPLIVERFFARMFAGAEKDEHENVDRKNRVRDIRVTPDLGVVTSDREEHGSAAILLRELERQRSFEREQAPLHVDAAAESGERSIRADDAMTWHDDRQRIRAVRRTDCATRRRFPDRVRDIEVRQRAAVRNLSQHVPDTELERRAARRE